MEMTTERRSGPEGVRAPATSAAVRPKEFHFPVTVAWRSGRRVAAHVEGKQAIEITPPTVFRGTDPRRGARRTSSSPRLRPASQ